MATIKSMDNIIVMRGGKISMVGSFSELIMKSAYFKEIIELQEI